MSKVWAVCPKLGHAFLSCLKKNQSFALFVQFLDNVLHFISNFASKGVNFANYVLLGGRGGANLPLPNPVYIVFSSGTPLKLDLIMSWYLNPYQDGSGSY